MVPSYSIRPLAIGCRHDWRPMVVRSAMAAGERRAVDSCMRCARCGLGRVVQP